MGEGAGRFGHVWFRRLGLSADPPESRWTDSSQLGASRPEDERAGLNRRSHVFARLWLGFMTARVMAALVLVLIPVLFATLGGEPRPRLIVISVIYLLATVWQRWMVGSRSRLQVTGRQLWACLILDVLAIALLNEPSNRLVNYHPLLSLPLLYASVLGTRKHAIGMAAALGLLLLFDVWHANLNTPGIELSPLYLQAGLKGLGAFLVAGLINQISVRLDREIRNVQINRDAVRAEIKVNELVLSEMTQGVLVVDRRVMVRSANPAAMNMLGADAALQALPFDLDGQPQWAELSDFVIGCFASNIAKPRVIQLPDLIGGTRSVQLTGKLVMPDSAQGRGLQWCVVFMQDMRQIEARIREEKMASMGRMSAAVAHEIRNPLSAIVQANALLMEELELPRQKKMSDIVAQNALRIAQTVEDVLDVSRFPKSAMAGQCSVRLQPEVVHICQEWMSMNGVAVQLHVDTQGQPWRVRFDSEHLRRVLVNLLDNARRHVDSGHPVIRVWAGLKEVGPVLLPCLVVGNSGQPIDIAIEQHLFEPFFSSQARSSGLGLYICRQLCEVHGATIRHERGPLPGESAPDEAVIGNLFGILFQWAEDQNLREGAPAGA